MLMGAPVRRARTVYALPSGRFLLGAITPDQAAEQVFPLAKVTGGAGHTLAVRNYIVQAAQTGQMFPAYLPGTPDCAGVPGSIGAPLLSTIGGTIVKFAPAAGPAAPFVFAAGIVVNIAGFVAGIFTHHHQQAVAKERGTLCVEVPAANNALQAIDQAVQQGYLSPQQAISGLSTLVAQFQSAVSGILKGSDPTSGQCNAACVMLSELRAAALEKQSVYQDLAAAQAAAAAPPPPPAPGPSPGPGPAPSAVSSAIAAITSGKVSSLLPWAAAGIVLYLVLEG